MNKALLARLEKLVKAADEAFADPAVQSMHLWRGDWRAIRYAYAQLTKDAPTPERLAKLRAKR